MRLGVVVVALLAVPGTAAADTRVTARPATAAPGAAVALRGEGFPAGARIRVHARSRQLGRARADARGGFAVGVAAPKGSWTRLRVITRGGGRRVVTRLTRPRAGVEPESEVASSTGAWLRWSPARGTPGTVLRVRAGGLESGARYRIALAGAAWRGRSSRAGALRLRATLPAAVPGIYRGILRSRRAVLPFPVVLDARSPLPSPPAPDRSPPPPPAIHAPADGTLVNRLPVTVRGTAEPGATVAVGTGRTTADRAGAWTLALTLGDGPHALTATATDRAGNRSQSSPPTRITVDTHPPAAPTISSPPDGTLRNDAAVTVTGEAEPGSTVTLAGRSVTAAADRAWAVDLTLAEGVNDLVATATDAAGNRSAASTTTRVTVDTHAPAAPAITGPASGARLVTTTSVALNGTAEPGSSVEIEDEEVVGRVTADSAGAWALTLTDTADGLHGYNAVATDAAGNRSTESNTVNVTVGTRLMAASAGTTRSPTGRFAFASSQSARFQCSLDAQPFAACTSPAAYAGLADGTHTFRLRAVDGAGNFDPTPATQAWTVDTAASAADVRVAAAGDVSCEGICGQAKTAALVTDVIKPAAVLGLGDYQYPFGTLDRFERYYDPTWGLLKAQTYPINGGEHDFYGRGDYLTYFAGSAVELQPEGSFSFDLGAWHVIALNSYCFQRASCNETAVTAWLQADLAASTARCTLAYLHEPYWTSTTTVHSRQTRTAPWIRALYDAGADLLLQGHNHDYERFAPQDPDSTLDPGRGLASFVVGTGGRGFYGFVGPPAPNSVTRASGTYGVLSLALHADGYDFAFVPEPGKSFADSGAAVCH